MIDVVRFLGSAFLVAIGAAMIGDLITALGILLMCWGFGIELKMQWRREVKRNSDL